MKYRIRTREQKPRTHFHTKKRFIHPSRKQVRPISSLTATDEKISFGEGDPKGEQKRPKIRLHPLRLLKSVALEIELFLRAAVNGAKKLAALIKNKVRSTIEKRAAKEEARAISSIPVALGALCGCAAVATFTLAVMALAIIAPYAVRHETVTVPDLEGKELSALSGDLDKINLTVVYENNPDVADGRIISQSAPAGATRRVNTQSGYFDLRVTVCKKEPISIPTGIKGLPLRDATLKLKNSGLSYTVTEEYSATVQKGAVISIYPAEGEEVEKGAQVRLTVSLGEKETTLIVPDLSGLDENEAIRRIKLSGFTVGSIIYTPSEKPLGTVVSQGLRPHGYAPEGSAISIWVAAT